MRKLFFFLLLAFVLPLAQAGTKTNNQLQAVAIIGTGQVGSALGSSLGRLGHPIIYGSRKPDSEQTLKLLSRSGNARAVLPLEAVQHANIIVLALPFEVALDLLPKMKGLAGKVLIDPMNTLVFDDARGLVYQSQELLAEKLQKLAPKAHVVKAFNAINSSNMSPERTFQGPISVPMAGDNLQAKKITAQLIEELGLQPTDVGPLFNARFLEAMAPLYVYMNAYHKPSRRFEYSFSRSPLAE